MDISPLTGLQFQVHGTGSLDTEVTHAFVRVRTERGYGRVARARWHIPDTHQALEHLEGMGEVLLVGSEVDGERLGIYGCVSTARTVIAVSIERRVGDRPACVASVAATSMDEAVTALEGLRVVFPESDPWAEGSLPVVFWNHNQYGADRREREIDPLRWDAIAANYPPALRETLAALAAASAEDISARLHLWHGPPGTGKTHAVRMLGTAWSSWCELHYITDPERFFGSAEYMMDVVLEPSERWRLVVLEDAGEFLGADAPAATGQGFARLLNLTDGILGHGARTMLLMTTNADLRTMHPATRRAGRAASHLTFPAFEAEAAQQWLAAHGATQVTAERPLTLAELYARRDDTSPLQATDAPRAFGFG